MKNRLLTDAVREIRNTRSRFLSLLVLSALAVAFLAGLLDKPEPARPEELLAVFDWDKVPRTDVRLPRNLF